MLPNIILFISDDHGYLDSGVYGDDYVRTPNIDELAKESMLFTNAFAASPLCVPSRCVIQTGKMCFRNGAHAFGAGISDDVKTMPEYFRELGYYTAHVGKWHHGDGKQPEYDFRDPDEYTAVEFLAGYDKEKPLLLVVCTHPPHLPWSENTTYDLARVNLPPTFVDTTATRQCRANYYTDVTKMDDILGRVTVAMRDHGFEDSFFMYTTDQGANWPFAKWCVYDAGLRVPLLIRWPGNVRPGSRSDAMICLSDVLPTCLDATGTVPPDDLDGLSFLQVLTGEKREHRDSVFGSHTGYIGKDNNKSSKITIMYPMRTVRTETHRYILNLSPDVDFTNHITDCPPTSRWYIPVWDSWLDEAKNNPDAGQKVSAYLHRPEEELYDISADPHEQDNLAGRPEYADLCNELRREVMQWCAEQGDSVAADVEPRLGTAVSNGNAELADRCRDKEETTLTSKGRDDEVK